MKMFYLALLLGLVLSCKNKTSPEEKAVQDAFAAVKSNPADSTFTALDAAITHFVEVKGYADSTAARHLLAAARLANEHNRINQSLSWYEKYLSRYPDRPDAADKISEVITMTAKLDKPELQQILYKSFAVRFPQDSRTADYSQKITNKEITVDSTLKYIGQNMFDDSTFRLNEPMAMLYIEGCELAAMADPKLPNAPEHLHRAAETARTLRDVPRAIQLYDWIIDAYPSHNRGATSLFLKAFTYDNDLKDFQKAGKLYNEFLTKYPNNEFAESAKFLLDNLGKSEDELRKIIEQKQKDNIQ